MKKSVLTLCAIAGLGLQAMAQGSIYWTPQATGFATPSRGILDVVAPTANDAWAITYDGSGNQAKTHDYTRTTNGGTTWTPGTIPNATTWAFSNLSAINGTHAWVAMYNEATGGNGRVYHTADGGATWTQQATGTYAGANGFLNIVHMFDANNGWLQGDPNNGYFEMYTTTDGGTTWTRVPQANIPANLSGEYGLVRLYETVGNNIIYFGTNKGRIFKSVDAGLNWTVTGNTGLTAIEDIAFADANNGLAMQGSDLVKTTDGGATWTLVPYLGNVYTNDLVYVPGTVSTYVTSGAATGFSGTSYSQDGGMNWVDYDNGSQRTALDFFDRTTGYAGGFNQDATTGGIFKFTGTVFSGISNKEFSKHLNVYPNPSNGLVTVELSKANGKSVSIEVLDVLGRSVYAKKANVNGGAFNTQLELNHLNKGVYMVQVQTGENVSIRKIVIE